MSAKVGQVRIVSLGSAEQFDDASRRGFRLLSKLKSLRATVLRWSQRAGLRLVLREFRSCHHRIRLLQKSSAGTEGLLFEDLRRSLRLPTSSDNCIERQPYILGIRTLEKDRPWTTLGDIELFLQGWFLAEQWYSRSLGKERGATIPASSVLHRASNSMPHPVVRQSSSECGTDAHGERTL